MPKNKNITFSDDEALSYIQNLENPHRVGWDGKVWRTPKEKGFDKNLIAYGLDIRLKHNPIVYNFLKSKGRLGDPWLTDAEAKQLTALTFAQKKDSIAKAIAIAGGNVSLEGYNRLAGMAWHGHPMKMLLDKDSLTGKAFRNEIANGGTNFTRTFDTYYSYGSNAKQFADRMKLDLNYRTLYVVDNGDYYKKIIINPKVYLKPKQYESTWKPEQPAKTIYPLNNTTPQSISSWSGTDAPNATPRLKDFLEVRQEDLNRGVDVYGDPVSPFSLRLRLPSLTSLLQLNNPLKLTEQYLADALGLSDIQPLMPSIFPRFKDGKVPTDPYERFRWSLPDNLKNTPESEYSTRRYWELNGKPKSFSEAVERGMYDLQEDGWHANSVAENKETGEYEFMKPRTHPTVNKELEWYYSDEGKEFRKKYKHVQPKDSLFDKYVPRLKNGKLPRYNTGLVPGLTEERSDNTRVAKPEVYLPVKRLLLKKLVTPELMLLATRNKPIISTDQESKHGAPKPETFVGEMTRVAGGDFVKADRASSAVQVADPTGIASTALGAMDLGMDLNRSMHEFDNADLHNSTALSAISVLPFLREFKGLKTIKPKDWVGKLREWYERRMSNANSPAEVNKALRLGRYSDAADDSHLPQIVLESPMDKSVFGGNAPLSNFMARNNLSYEDIVKHQQTTENFIDGLLMDSYTLENYFNIAPMMQDAYRQITGDTKTLLGPNQVSDIINKMAHGDTQALAIRKEMIRSGGFSAYDPKSGKFHIEQKPAINNPFLPKTISIRDQIAIGHEFGHKLFHDQNVAKDVKDVSDKIRALLHAEGKPAGIGDVTGFYPEDIKDEHIRNYLIENNFNEILQRVSQWKDFKGIRDAGQLLTGPDIIDMIYDYRRLAGVDNNMTEMIKAIRDPNKFANFFSPFAKTIIPIGLVGGTIGGMYNSQQLYPRQITE